MKTLFPAALLLTAVACSSTGSPGAPAPGNAALAYAMPTSSPLMYEIADTAQVAMDMMGQAIQVNMHSTATVGLELTRSGPGLAGTLTFEAISGAMTNTMGPGMTISEADKPGPTGLTVDPRGVVEVTSKPELSTVMLQVFGSETYVQRMFVRLPASVVQPGTMWTDTVKIDDSAAGMSTETTSVVASTLRGDTTVAGTRLLVIDSDITTLQRIAGTQEGVEIRQSLTGSSTAVTLWDPARGIIVERIETGSASGDMELPAMGVSGIPVNIRQTQVMRLRG